MNYFHNHLDQEKAITQVLVHARVIDLDQALDQAQDLVPARDQTQAQDRAIDLDIDQHLDVA